VRKDFLLDVNAILLSHWEQKGCGRDGSNDFSGLEFVERWYLRFEQGQVGKQFPRQPDISNSICSRANSKLTFERKNEALDFGD
jgi:hypothetical protein